MFHSWDRLLNNREIQQQTDQYYDKDNEWLPVDKSRIGTAYVEGEDYLVRREIKLSPIDLSEEISPWCLACKKKDCIVDGAQCEMIRVYLKARTE